MSDTDLEAPIETDAIVAEPSHDKDNRLNRDFSDAVVDYVEAGDEVADGLDVLACAALATLLFIYFLITYGLP